MEVREISKKQKNSLPALEREELVKKMRKEDDKVISGMFEFLDAQGGWLEFAYRKYPGALNSLSIKTHWQDMWIIRL